MTENKLTRLFIAAVLPDELTAVLLKAQRLLSDNAVRISLTKGEQFHLTLRFIGETGEAEAERILIWFSSLSAPSVQARRFIQAGYGAFPAGEGLTLWAGLEIGPEMRRRAAMMETSLRSLGCAPQPGTLIPHVTLARRAELKRPLGGLAPLLPRASGTLLLGDIVLFKSEFTPGGMRYTRLSTAGG